MAKTGKEVKLSTPTNYNVVMGSINNKIPNSFYINISAWAEPQYDIINYNRELKNLNKKIKQSFFNLFDSDVNCNIIKERTIANIDIRESGIRYGKRSFMNCEITLFIKPESYTTFNIMKLNLNDIINTIIKSTFEDNEIFRFHKKKR